MRHSIISLKSVGAVLAGFVVVVILSTGTDAVLEALNIFPRGYAPATGMLVLAFVYRSLYTVLGGYVTALVAPDRPMRHVKILAILGTIAGITGVVAGWNLSDHWYPIALAVTAFPLVWWGGKLRVSKQ